MTIESKNLISVKEATGIMGYSRMHIIRLIKSGKIKAKKIGRSYVIDRDSLGGIYKKITSHEEKEVIKAVNKIVKEFGPALKKLGNK